MGYRDCFRGFYRCSGQARRVAKLKRGGEGGPGGFDGGRGLVNGQETPGNGLGPGGGKYGTDETVNPGAPSESIDAVGHGAYAGSGVARPTNGQPYGSTTLLSLVGGAGGGGEPSTGGSGGGGAILLASDTSIELNGVVYARGGTGPGNREEPAAAELSESSLLR